ncbi:MAG: hypothetical protein WKF57_06645 [Nakamurella sp.]
MSARVPLKYRAQVNPSVPLHVRNQPNLEASFTPMESVGETGSLDLAASRLVGEVTQGYSYYGDGDVLLAKVTPCFENGKAALVGGSLNGIGFGSTELTVVRPVNASGRYLYYTTQSAEFQQAGKASMTGAGGLKRVPDAFVRLFPLPVDGATTQQQIADFLDRETAEIDTLIDKQTLLIELLDERRKSVITQAVTKGLDPRVPMKDSGVPWVGEVPAHWKVTRLKFQSSLQTGLTLGRVPTGDVQEVPYLRVANVQSDRIDVSDVKTVIVPIAEVDRYRLRKGDVLLTEGGDRDKLGRGAVWDGRIDPCLHQNHVFAVRVGPDLVSTYLTYVLEASPGRIYFDLTAKQSTNLASTNSTTLGRFTFGLPDVAEQGAILDFLGSAETQFAALRSQAARSVSLLRERRSALITAAVTGQIDVEAMS